MKCIWLSAVVPVRKNFRSNKYVAEIPVEGLNPLNAELNPIYHLLALLGGATIVVVSSLRVKTGSLCPLFCTSLYEPYSFNKVPDGPHPKHPNVLQVQESALGA